MKILMAPMNMANMPMQLVRELRKRGHTAEHVQYTLGRGHKFNYELDNEVNIKALGGRIPAHAATLKSYLERDFDIYHFWNKSLFFENYYNSLTGFDLPLIKARGARIAYRFTGFDARLPSLDKKVNRHSPFHQGYTHLFDEDLQKKYLDFLEEYVDQFIVQDPEMGQFAKNAKVVPRALDLTLWKTAYPGKTDNPLIVHAPSKPVVKGTKFIEQAVQELQDEGLQFQYKRVENMDHQDAIDLYRKADIIVDQILIGATGVLTLEGWALGKPVVVFLREDLFNDFYDTKDLPIGNATPENIKQVLKELITDQDRRLELGKRGRKLVEKYHSLPKATDDLIDIYDGMMKKDPMRPKGTKDVDYLQAQAILAEKGKQTPASKNAQRSYSSDMVFAARNINNALAVIEKNTLIQNKIDEKKNVLLSRVDDALNNGTMIRPDVVKTLFGRYSALVESLENKNTTVAEQVENAKLRLDTDTVVSSPNRKKELNADQRLEILKSLLPGYAIKILKPLIVVRRIVKYRKIKAGDN